MEFNYLISNLDQNLSGKEFLPSIAFAPLGTPQPPQGKAGVFSRRITHYLHFKFNLIPSLNSRWFLPIDQQKGDYIRLSADNTLEQMKSLIPVSLENLDYILWGTLDMKDDSEKIELSLHLHSIMDDKTVYGDSYRGEAEGLLEYINDYSLKILKEIPIKFLMEEVPDFSSRPLFRSGSFSPFLHAIDTPGEDQFLDEILRLEKDNKDVLTILIRQGERFFQLGNIHEGEKIADKILHYLPDYLPANLLKIKILLGKGNNIDDINKIIEYIEKKLRQFSSLAPLPFILAKELMESDLREITGELFHLALLYNPGDPHVAQYYGKFLIATENEDKALEIYKIGYENSPLEKNSIINYAQILSQKGEYKKAEELYLQGIPLYDRDPDFLSSYALHWGFRDEKEKALSLINQALEISPENPLLNMMSAWIYHRFNEREQAVYRARLAVELTFPSRSPLAEESLLLWSRYLSDISREEQDENRSKFIEAVRLISRNQLRPAVEILDEVTRREPVFMKAWFMKGIALRRMKKIEEALFAFEQIDHLFPNQTDLMHEKGKCYILLGKYQQAFIHIAQAFRQNPHNPEIMQNMALVYMRLGMMEESLVLFQQAKKMNPADKYLDKYINELHRIIKRKQAGRGNGSLKD